MQCAEYIYIYIFDKIINNNNISTTIINSFKYFTQIVASMYKNNLLTVRSFYSVFCKRLISSKASATMDSNAISKCSSP
jgi:hypothetical protein